MKKIFGFLAVALLAVNVLFACGGMTPAAVPSGFPTNVPSLPSDPGMDTPSDPGMDTPSDPGIDTPSNPGTDNPSDPGDGVGNPVEDTPNNPTDFGDLPTDLPQDGQTPSNQDGNFVPAVL